MSAYDFSRPSRAPYPCILVTHDYDYGWMVEAPNDDEFETVNIHCSRVDAIDAARDEQFLIGLPIVAFKADDWNPANRCTDNEDELEALAHGY